jgi:hypothetical protein
MTTFKGGRTGFGNNAGDSMGAPKTNFCGRGAMPSGKLQRYPGAVANISGGNRRLAKSNHGDGGGSGTTIKSRTAFGKGK